MSDIPDWLVGLAAQRDDDEEDEIPAQEQELEPEPSAWESREIERAEAPVFAPDVDDEAEALDMMSALRSQVESEAEEQAAAVPDRRTSGFRIPGLVPWQQFVLSVLLFMDIAVIGLLFLVMLGRIAIP